jgi:SAM-dependent methyltransferase
MAEELDPLRQALHGMWATVADSWEEQAGFVDARAAGVTAALLDGAELGPGDRVLELACGAGGLGLAAAERVGDDGNVVLSDVAQGMVDAAARRAEALGLTNVTTAARDIEAIDEPDATFDAVLCREGLMFAADPVRAAGELRRVLRPGGRAAVSVWGPRARNPWLAAVLDGVSEATGVVVPPPGIPGPFSLDDADRLRSVLLDGGFETVTVTEVPVPWQAASFDEWWERTTALAGPIASVLAGLPAETVDAVQSHAATILEPHRTAEGYDLPGVGLVAIAR